MVYFDEYKLKRLRIKKHAQSSHNNNILPCGVFGCRGAGVNMIYTCSINVNTEISTYRQ